MPCYLCNAIEQNVRGAVAGKHLVQRSPAEVSANAAGREIRVTHYKCSECGAGWRHVDDAFDPSAGWSFVPGTRRG